MRKVLYISDYSSKEISGGTEICDDIIINHLNCDFIKSSFFTNGEGYDKFIVSNFFEISEEGKRWLIDNAAFYVIEHDYKIFPNRVPSEYPEFRIPKEDIRNVDFYRAAEKVVFQSSYQKYIFDLNLDIPKSVTLHANLWTDEQLDIFAMAPHQKNGRCYIQNSSNSIKGTQESIRIAEHLKIPFDLHDSKPYDEFIDKLQHYSAVSLQSVIPESFGRIALEARMMGVLPLVNANMACAYEKFYDLPRFAIIYQMRSKREWLLKTLVDWIN